MRDPANKISAIAAIGFAAFALAGTGIAQGTAGEERLTELVAQLRDEDSWQVAASELLQIGKPAVADLAAALMHDLDAPVEEQMWKERVLEILSLLGKDAVDVAPALYDAFGEVPWQLIPGTARAYAEIAPYSENWTRIKHGDSPVLTVTLGQLGQATVTVPGLATFTIGGVAKEDLRAMNDVYQEFVRLNYRCTAESWAVEGDLVSLLRSQLGEQSLPRIEVTMDLLAQRGLEARDALPSLVRVLGLPKLDEMSYAKLIRLKTARMILRVSPHDESAGRAYAYLLTHDLDIGVRRESATRLGILAEGNVESLPALLTATRDRNSSVVREAITALGMFGPRAEKAIPTLEGLTGHEDPQIAERAKAALRQIRR